MKTIMADWMIRKAKQLAEQAGRGERFDADLIAATWLEAGVRYTDPDSDAYRDLHGVERVKPAKPLAVDSGALQRAPDPESEYLAERLAICRVCEHCRGGAQCGVLIERRKGAMLLGSQGIPNRAARCPADPPRWLAIQ